jgi:hypothetical protein
MTGKWLERKTQLDPKKASADTVKISRVLCCFLLYEMGKSGFSNGLVDNVDLPLLLLLLLNMFCLKRTTKIKEKKVNNISGLFM